MYFSHFKENLKHQYLNHFLMFLALVFLLAAFSYYRIAIKNVENELCEKIQSTTERTADYLYYRMNRVQASAETLRSVLRDILSTDSDFPRQLEEYERIQQLMMDVLDEDVISYCRIYLEKDKIYDSQLTSSYSLNPMASLELPSDHSSLFQPWWMDTHLQNYSVLFQSERVISYICPIRAQINFEKPNGVLAADINISELQELLCTSENDEFYLVNKDGKILISQNSNQIGRSFLDADQIAAASHVSSGRFTVKDTIYIYSSIENTDWYLFTAIDHSQVYTYNENILMTLFLFLVALLSISFSLSLSIHNLRIKGNMSKIQKIVNQLKDNQFNTEISHSDTKQLLNTKFISDLDKETEQITNILMDAISEQYRNRLAIAEYQMQALQAQIKPHFLYNTLDSIKWIVMDKKMDEGAWMLNELSRFIRLSFTKGKHIVPLSEEIEHIKAYMGLMQKRFTDKFSILFELDESAMQYTIPKFTLQPFVENALLHGILYCTKPDPHIIIRSWTGEDCYGIDIEDNGDGMPQEVLDHILDIRNQKQSEENYGVYNVYERLMIFSNKRCHFHISSKEGLGTCVSIELPLA